MHAIIEYVRLHCAQMPAEGIVPTLKELMLESVRPRPLLSSPLTLIYHQDLNTYTHHKIKSNYKGK